MEVFVLCVMCMRIWSGICLHLLLGMQGCGSSWVCVGPCSCVRCLVFHARCSFCVFMFCCLVMSSPVGVQSLIGHHQCVFGSMSYLIFSDKISSRVVVVCLSSICCIFSSFSFHVDRVKQVHMCLS